MAIAVVGTPDAAALPTASGGTLYTIPSGAPSVGDHDVLAINSNTIVTSVVSSGGAAWTLRVNATNNQGAYIYTRKATGGEPATVTVTTSGDHPTDLHWIRLSGADAYSTGGFTRVDNVNGTALPATATGTLAATGMAVVAFAALHNHDGALATSPSWANGFTAGAAASSGSAGSSASVVGFSGYKLGVGTASETVDSVTWTNSTRNRYALWVAFTAAAGGSLVHGAGVANLGALAGTGVGKRTVHGTGLAALGGLTATGIVSSAGAIVPRPNTGTVPRPNTGIVARP